MQLKAYRWEFVFHRYGTKQGGKVTAENLEEARTMIVEWLKTEKNQKRSEILDLSDEDITSRLTVKEYERSKEVWDTWYEMSDAS